MLNTDNRRTGTKRHESSGLQELTSPEFNEQNLSIFEGDPFKEFTQKKFKELLKKDNMRKMISMREKALEVRHTAQVEYMNKMFENKRFSPRTFQNKKLELEKWVVKEREQIKKSVREIEKGWMSFAEAMKRVTYYNCKACTKKNIVI